MEKKNNFAYITALSNDTFLPGVKALLKSLKHVNTAYPLGIMIPKSLEGTLRNAIEDAGLLKAYNAFIIVEDDLIIPSDIPIDRTHHWAYTFFKLMSTSLTQFTKIILIDCDVIVLKNMDELFQRKSMSATSAGVCVHPDWKGQFTSGLVVIEPNIEIFTKLIAAIEPTVKRLHNEGKRTGDQDVIQSVFPDWGEQQNLLIHEKYNVIWYAIPDFCRYYQMGTKDIYMVHFTGAKKPWAYDKNFAITELWSRFSAHEWIAILFKKSKRRKLKILLFKTFVWIKYWKLCR